LRPASSQQKIDKSFPPSGVLKWTIPIGKRPKKRPKKNSRAFPLLLKGKNQRISTGKQPKKNWRAFPPFRGFKIDHSDRQATRKTPKKK
jgi:hypothetical protein